VLYVKNDPLALARQAADFVFILGILQALQTRVQILSGNSPVPSR
jgi:hypothetical protein